MSAYSQHSFEAGLQVGEEVCVRWSNGGKRWSAKAKVVAVHRGSIVVELTEPLNGYKEGVRVSVPRVGTGRWTPRECVLPSEFATAPV